MNRTIHNERSLSPLGDRADGARAFRPPIQTPPARRSLHLASGPPQEASALHAGGRLYAALTDTPAHDLAGMVDQLYFSFSRPVQTGQGTRYLSLAFGTPTSALRDTTSGTALPYQETTIGRIVSAAISAFSLPAADHLSLGNTLQALLRAGLRSFASRTLN